MSHLFFFVLGSHLPISRKLLGDFAALLQSPIKWYNEKQSSRNERLGDQSFGVVSLLLQLRKRRLRCLGLFLGLLQLAPTLSYKRSEAYPHAVAHFSKTQGWLLCPLGVHFGHTNT